MMMIIHTPYTLVSLTELILAGLSLQTKYRSLESILVICIFWCVSTTLRSSIHNTLIRHFNQTNTRRTQAHYMHVCRLSVSNYYDVYVDMMELNEDREEKERKNNIKKKLH